MVRARQRVREWSRQQGFSLVNQTKIVTAASELVRNTVQYGGGGIMHLEVVNQSSHYGLQLTCEDQGPGIPDIAVVLQEGYSTPRGRNYAVILDILLPREDSWPLLAELKGQEESHDIPIVVVTTVEDQRKGLALGADAYYVKPIERLRLLATLQRLILRPQIA